MKPKLLYHGSSEYIKILTPHLANDANNPAGCLNGVYATDIKKVALAFTLGGIADRLGRLSRFMEGKGSMVFVHGTPNIGGIGWLYILSSKNFKEISPHQWISQKPIKPLKIIKIRVDKYSRIWRYATTAEKNKWKAEHPISEV